MAEFIAQYVGMRDVYINIELAYQMSDGEMWSEALKRALDACESVAGASLISLECVSC